MTRNDAGAVEGGCKMKIQWKQNPLETVIELDDRDIELLRLKVTIEELEERIYGAHFHLSNGRSDLDEALKELDVEGLEEAPLKAALDTKMGWFLGHLAGVHMGDCTCTPCSCLKCHVESLLGINTIKGLGKHSAYKVDGVCKTSASLAEAITRLENYEHVRGGAWLNYPEEDFNRHIPRWKSEAAHAAQWLREYRDAHFPDPTPGAQ